mgnify:CR=1 FL=1
MQAYACVIIYADAAGLVFVKERTVSPEVRRWRNKNNKNISYAGPGDVVFSPEVRS